MTYLQKVQQSDGTCGESEAERTSIVAQSLVLHALAAIDHPSVTVICERLAVWLMLRRQADWSFRTRPDEVLDLETTFYAIVALRRYQPALFTQAAIALLAKLLIAHEQAPGGPYRTSLVGNSLVAHFLATLEVRLPRLDSLITNALKDTARPTSAIDWLYRRQLSLGLPRSQRDPYWTIATQQTDGSWADDAGAPSAVMTAAALEMLGGRRLRLKKPLQKKPPAKDEYAPVLGVATEQITGWPRSMRAIGFSMLAKIRGADETGEICLMPACIAADLRDKSIDKAALVQLGVANIFVWIAYTIFDDFLDGEGQPVLLSVGTTSLRLALHIYRTTVPSADLLAIVEQCFTTMDSANTWEIANCRARLEGGDIIIGRLPRYGRLERLYERSLAMMTLPALAVLTLARVPLHGRDSRSIRTALRQYAIVRQMNDDLHDLREDIEAGSLTYVVTRLLQDAHLSGRHNLGELTDQLQRQLWFGSLDHFVTLMRSHIAASRAALGQSRLLQGDHYIHSLLDRQENSLALALQEQARMSEFMQAYRTTQD